MKIISLSIRNFRSLKYVTLAGLGDLVVLIGPNSSGKTNIVEALRFFFDGFTLQGPQDIKGIHDYVWFNRDASEKIIFTVTLRIMDNEFRYKKRVLFDLFEKEKPSIDRESFPTLPEGMRQFLGIRPVNTVEVTRCVRGPRSEASWQTDRLVVNGNVLIDQGEVTLGKDASRALYSDLTHTSTLDPQESLMGIVDQIFCCTLVDSFRTVSAARSRTQASKQLGERESFLPKDILSALASLGQSLEKIKEEQWEFIERSIKQIEPMVAEMRSIESKITIKEQGGRFQLPISMVGGGHQEVLGLLFSLREKNVILSLEEPELHMHPRLARRFFSVLKEASQRTQVFVTTHSTVFVDSADPSDTWIVRKEKSESIVRRFKEGAGLKEVLCSLGVRPSDIFFSNSIIFVEGVSDSIFITEIASQLGIDFEEYNVRVLPLGGKSRGSRTLRLWSDIAKNTNIPFFMILDADAEREAEQVAAEGILRINENLFLLKKGSIEDYYDQSKLLNVLRSLYHLGREDEQKVLERPRATSIERFLGQTNRIKESWKSDVAERMAELTMPNEVDDQLRDILVNIGKTIRESVLE